MKHSRAIVALLVLIPTLALAQKKPRPATLAIIGQARYVYVEAIDGNEFKPDLNPADRQAIEDVIGALRDWGRYVLTTKRGEAELVFVVRKGRAVEGDLGVGAGSGPLGGPLGGQGQGRNPRVREQSGVEVGPSDDLLQICSLYPDGKLSGPLWNHSARNGLDGPEVALLQQFKTAVERDYPQTASSKR